MKPRNQMVAMADIEPSSFYRLQDVDKKRACVVGGGKEIRTPDLPESFRDALPIRLLPTGGKTGRLSYRSCNRSRGIQADSVTV